MDEPYHPDVVAASVEVRSTGELEELAEPLDDSDDSRTPSLAPGTTLSREGEDPITVLWGASFHGKARRAARDLDSFTGGLCSHKTPRRGGCSPTTY
jgi:hypothetical protein